MKFFLTILVLGLGAVSSKESNVRGKSIPEATKTDAAKTEAAEENESKIFIPRGTKVRPSVSFVDNYLFHQQTADMSYFLLLPVALGSRSQSSTIVGCELS